jgi:2-dehydropantoate 2-reductase
MAAGIALSEKDLEAWYPVLHSLSPQGKTTMLQYIEAGRKTGVEIFGQKVLELSETYAIATPVNRTMVQIIRVMEQRSQDLKI